MFSVQDGINEPSTSDDEWAFSVKLITLADLSDDESFNSIFGIDKREEVFKKTDLKKSKEFEFLVALGEKSCNERR